MGVLVGCLGLVLALMFIPVMIGSIIADPVTGVLLSAFLVWVAVHSWRRQTRMAAQQLGIYRPSEYTEGLETIPTGQHHYQHPAEPPPPNTITSLDDFDDEELE